MAKPRIFVSSTFYDLKHIRASLDFFINSLGYESILSEKGNIAYKFDMPLDESCYREIETVDIFVLIIGGRYGSEATPKKTMDKKEFFSRYESVTKREFETAIERNIPTYILIDANVHSEYYTYLKNKENEKVEYAYVDSINIFEFIETIFALPRNNPVFEFSKFEQIEDWLKEQWAGLFKSYLQHHTQQNEIKTLTIEVEQLQELSKTMKTYLEAIMTNKSKIDKEKIIKIEKERLENDRIINIIGNSYVYNTTGIKAYMNPVSFYEALYKSTDINHFYSILEEAIGNSIETNSIIGNMANSHVNDLILMRKEFGLRSWGY